MSGTIEKGGNDLQFLVATPESAPIQSPKLIKLNFGNYFEEEMNQKKGKKKKTFSLKPTSPI